MADENELDPRAMLAEIHSGVKRLCEQLDEVTEHAEGEAAQEAGHAQEAAAEAEEHIENAIEEAAEHEVEPPQAVESVGEVKKDFFRDLLG